MYVGGQQKIGTATFENRPQSRKRNESTTSFIFRHVVLIVRIVRMVLELYTRFPCGACPSPARGDGRLLVGLVGFGTKQTCLLFVVGPGRMSGPG